MCQQEFQFEGESQSPTGIERKLFEAVGQIRHPWQRRLLLALARRGNGIPDYLLTPIDYTYRPASFWTTQRLVHLLTNIKGAARKRSALELAAAGHLDQASESLLVDSLSSKERTTAGKIHPNLMGGEYLTDFAADEVEIARVTLASTTQDVISIRASPVQGGIAYRVVDEYGSNFKINQPHSRHPLPLRQLVQLIESAESEEMGAVGIRLLQTQLDCADLPADSFAEFAAFTSEFYPDLSKHYWFATQRWLNQQREKAERR